MNPIQGLMGKMGGGAMMGALRQRPEDEAVDPSKMARPRPVADSSGITTVQNLADVSRPELPKRNMADLGGGVAPPRNMADIGGMAPLLGGYGNAPGGGSQPAPGMADLAGGGPPLRNMADVAGMAPLLGGFAVGRPGASQPAPGIADQMQQVNGMLGAIGQLAGSHPVRQRIQQEIGSANMAGFDPRRLQAAAAAGFQPSFEDAQLLSLAQDPEIAKLLGLI